MAHDQCSHEAAGAAADQKVSKAEQATLTATESVGDAPENATDTVPGGK
jgi:hypothetical protein